MSNALKTYYAHGKLLLTGEYFVLDGVPALAIPTRLGQRLVCEPGNTEGRLSWEAVDKDGTPWLTTELALPLTEAEDYLEKLFLAAEQLHSGCTTGLNGKAVTTRLEFDREWGLGSSSTLVHCLAELLDVNPYSLLERTFGGSGYDLACAGASGPIIYERNGSDPKVTSLNWYPEWLDRTYFIYRNQKQNSREGIKAYRERKVPEAVKEEIAALTAALVDTSHPRAAAQIFAHHEALVGKTLGLMPVKEKIFPDFPGSIKSLGAWGGDFVWAISKVPPEETMEYFNAKGFPTVIPYASMIL